MSEIPEKYTIDNAKNHIKQLQDQNSIDFQEIQLIKNILLDFDDKVRKAININNTVNVKIKEDYEAIKIDIINNIEKLKNQLLEDNRQELDSFYYDNRAEINKLVNDNKKLLNNLNSLLSECSSLRARLDNNLGIVTDTKNDVIDLKIEVRTSVSQMVNKLETILNKAKTDLENSTVDITGVKHGTINDRILADLTLIYENIYLLSYVPFEGLIISVDEAMFAPVRNITIKGKTYQNVLKYEFSEKSNNVTFDSKTFTFSLNASGNYQNCFFAMNDLIKPSTTYTVVGYVDSNTLNDTFILSSNEVNNKSISAFSNTIVSINPKVVGRIAYKLTTRDSFDNVNMLLRCFLNNKNTKGSITLKIALYEGDLTNEINGFGNGIHSLGEQENNTLTIKTTGKNIVNLSKLSKQSHLLVDKNEDTISVEALNTNRYPNVNYSLDSKFIEMCRGKYITISCERIENNSQLQTPSLFQITTVYADGSRSYLGLNVNRLRSTHLIKENLSDFIIGFYASNTSDYYEELPKSTFVKPQIEISNEASPFEKYKENEYKFKLSEPLRSLPNGVCDEVNLQTGKIIRRVGKVVFDGSSDEIWTLSTGSTPFIATHIKDMKNILSSLLCDTLPVRFDGTENMISANRLLISGVMTCGTNNELRLRTGNLSTTLENSLNWLKNNPTTVYYQLKDEVIEDIIINEDVKSFNGHNKLFLTNNLDGYITCEMATDVNKLLSDNITNTYSLRKNLSQLEIEQLETEVDNDFRISMLELGL